MFHPSAESRRAVAEQFHANASRLSVLTGQLEVASLQSKDLAHIARRRRNEARARMSEIRMLVESARETIEPLALRPYVPPPPGASSTYVQDSDAPIDELHRQYATTRDPAIRTRLIEHYDKLALSLVRQFRSRRESFDDLVQVARIGLIHAVDRFDPDRGRPFGGFARVTINGELKRHVRDKTWAMRVPRSLQEHYLAVVRAADDLTAELGRSPRIPEIAAVCDLTEEEVLEAMELGRRQRPSSLDVPEIEGQRRLPEPGTPERGLEQVENRALVAKLLERLPERERRIIHLRFVDGLTQVEIAEEIGMSQMYVSRLLTRLLERMRIIASES